VYDGAGPVATTQYFHLAPGYGATVSRSGAFTISWGRTPRYVGLVFGGTGRKSGVTYSTKWITTSHGVTVRTLAQTSVGRRATLGMVIVPVGSSVAFRTDASGSRIVITRGGVSRTVHLGRYLY
jgi:hypothetical protein